MVNSFNENECPVCGHKQSVKYMYGDPETCDKCGHFTEPKKYRGSPYTRL
jgi:ribosomal protein L37AE/L43A